MAADMVVALGGATVDGSTLFGHALNQTAPASASLAVLPPRSHTPGEAIPLGKLDLPQVRQTHHILCTRSPGTWGTAQGINEHGVAAGCSSFATRLTAPRPCLLATDLVRLVLERARSARQGVDLLTDLITRHGQCAPHTSETDGDGGYLIADAGEAFLVEASGRHWVYQEVREVRAAGDVWTVRQDWDRIAPGLAQHAIDSGWWPDDGSKLDFAGALCPDLTRHAAGLRRWGRATALLGQQNGHIDAAFVRHVLSGPDEDADEDGFHGSSLQAGCSFVAVVPQAPDRSRLAWWGVGPSYLQVHFPVFLEGQLPAAFTDASVPGDSLAADMGRLCRHLGDDVEAWNLARDSFGRLQGRFDQEAEECASAVDALRRQGSPGEVERQTSLFMQHCLERFREVWTGLLTLPPADHGLALTR